MSHFIEICEDCKKVISQCRCPSKNKEQRIGLCESCNEKREISKQIEEIKKNQKDLDPEFSDFVNKNFWKLI